ncbi:MAG TPA: Wzz/FepE/Etk N-terminal domain-containing protein [Pseudomonas sp.]|uniref:LPS O-antigen chain length determinant protein WzzB n=1 Tax=Pseudomonas sp. TaxID=306 RepID=UPI002B7F2B0D|nr:Wzz/FepE/Etk N-terminal domain-containing protein [Pseudomonas sp.]HTO18375.1 Wzz/FepE/Etk N-terminal domain-containing protein [Pseudomonas sp.]
MQDQPYRMVNENNDEIDLRELIRSLWDQRWIIVGITAFITLIAVLYAFLATPYYRVQSILRPVEVGVLDSLNATEVYELKPLEALARVSGGLSSYGNRLEFFQGNEDLFADLARQELTAEQAFENFNSESFAMLYPDPKKNQGEFVGLALTYPASMDGVSVVNEFVAFVLQRERERVASDLGVVIANRKANIEQRIEAARASYQAGKEAEIAALLEKAALKKAELEDELRALRTELKIRRENRLSVLDEAIRIARSLGIRKPTTPTAMADAGQGVRTEITSREIPLYFLGVDALEAERDVLRARTSDDFMEPRIGEIQKELDMLRHNRQVEVLQQRQDEDLYLSELAKLREEAARLEGIEFDASTLQLARIDQPAQKPLKRLKPKRALILALGVVLGGMLGVFVALMRNLMQPRRVRPAN